MFWKNSDWADAKLITVTTLDDDGPGSLRSALSASGKRIIVFSTSGIISVKSELDVNHPWCWVCGYTAGEEGVMLVGDGTVDSIVNVNTSDVILQGMTILCNNSGEGTRSLSVADKGSNPRRILLQHLATGVSEDENVIIWYDTQDVIYRECISAFSLLPDGKGPNLGSEGGGNFWVERNIFYGHRQRLPRTKADTKPICLVNNLSMNHQGSGASVSNSDGCELYAYGNIDWQRGGNADYYISTESDSPVYHAGNWLVRDGSEVDADTVKGGEGTERPPAFDYIKNFDDLRMVLHSSTGNKFYLDSDYGYRLRHDPFTGYVQDLVWRGEFAEVKSAYTDEMPIWTNVKRKSLRGTWDVGKLIDVTLGTLEIKPPEPGPEPPEPRPPGPQPPEQGPPPTNDIAERLESIDMRLGEVVDFVRTLKGALR